VRYVEQLRRYHARFDPDQVLVLIYDDFLADNEGTVRQVLRFLDADDAVPVAPVRANPTISVRSTRLNDMRLGLRDGRGPLLSAVRYAGKAVTSKRAREALYYPLQRRAVYRAAPPPDEAFMRELRRRYNGEVVALSEYLGRDLVGLWGYDELG
jgi:hypothetical protein